MYPRRSEAELISELLTAALDDLEKAMPYIPGTEVVSEDEDGNPIYEDVGPTPRFHMLLQKYVQKFGSGWPEIFITETLRRREKIKTINHEFTRITEEAGK